MIIVIPRAEPLSTDYPQRYAQSGGRAAARAARPASSAASKLAGIDTVTIASLNLHCGYSGRGAPYDVVSAICHLDADIICVQEAWLPDTAASSDGAADVLAEAARKLGGVVHRAALARWPSLGVLGLPPDSGAGELSIAVLTAAPVTRYQLLELGCAPGDTVPRLAQLLRVGLGGGAALDVVNTHLTHLLTSPLQLRRLRRQLPARPPGQRLPPAVIVGDLNMPRLLAAGRGGYAAAVRSPSWPAARPLLQLDHILAGPGVERVHGTVLPELGSDHRPVRAVLRLPVPAQAADPGDKP